MNTLRRLFKEFSRKHPNLYSIVIGVSVVLFVRGVLGFADLYLFPGHLPLSFGVSIAIGLALLYMNDFKLKEIEQQ